MLVQSNSPNLLISREMSAFGGWCCFYNWLKGEKWHKIDVLSDSLWGRRTQLENALCSTKSSTRKTGVLLYTSDDLSVGTHTIKIQCASEAVGISAIYSLQNDGKGMFEISESNYEVNKGHSVTIEVKRIGGSSGSTSVSFETLPDSAVHGCHYTNKQGTLTFVEGETSKTFSVNSINHGEVGDFSFYCNILRPTDSGILGFNTSASVLIKNVPYTDETNSISLIWRL